ncbi:hypothetical protein M422DRAFT_35145 [Sphaerobolus stellatus SS14]|uniref:Uncharacterized protein n=1 Tax=Sphaerobolus stellatus (strain SS14) TaxID=990650 RepID=A0A0C9TVD0_SPHS4|nr:hypothetical protein M422DRAFT_35145 [Sphaerobolus stellatus SS14]
MGESSTPLNRFVLSSRSILDTLFISQNPRRPAYATTTAGSTTTLWTVSTRGKLLEVAKINWVGEAGHSTVLVNGQLMMVENILQKSKGLFKKPTYSFVAGAVQCKWKRGRHSHLSPSNSMTVTGDIASCWICESTVPTSTSTSSSTNGIPRMLAAFVPPQKLAFKAELAVFPNSFDVIDHIVLTAILLVTEKNEWRISQSALSHAALQASLKAEIRGTLPPYTPSDGRYRPPSADNEPPPRPASQQLRRPHSAHAVRPGTSSGAPSNNTIGRFSRHR